MVEEGGGGIKVDSSGLQALPSQFTVLTERQNRM